MRFFKYSIAALNCRIAVVWLRACARSDKCHKIMIELAMIPKRTRITVILKPFLQKPSEEDN